MSTILFLWLIYFEIGVCHFQQKYPSFKNFKHFPLFHFLFPFFIFLPFPFHLFFSFALSLKVFSKKLNTIRSHKDLKIRITVLDFVIYTLRFFNFGNSMIGMVLLVEVHGRHWRMKRVHSLTEVRVLFKRTGKSSGWPLIISLLD